MIPTPRFVQLFPKVSAILWLLDVWFVIHDEKLRPCPHSLAINSVGGSQKDICAKKNSNRLCRPVYKVAITHSPLTVHNAACYTLTILIFSGLGRVQLNITGTCVSGPCSLSPSSIPCKSLEIALVLWCLFVRSEPVLLL